MTAPVQETFTIIVDTRTRPRLDSFLHQRFPWKSRALFQRMIREGAIVVNGATVKPSCRLSGGDRVRLTVPARDEPALAFSPGSIPVLYEDETMVVMNKPAGILTHPISGHQGDTLVNYLVQTFTHRKAQPMVCHRLDHFTSGAIMFVYDRTVRRQMQWQFEAHHVAKTYYAVVEGAFPEDIHQVDIPIGSGQDLRAVLSGESRKDSMTRIRCLCRNADASLVAAEPITGRQNQIRIHLAALGHPLAGDTRFGGSDNLPAPGHFLLHALTLRFFHPRQKMHAEITAPLPDYFDAFLRTHHLRPSH